MDRIAIACMLAGLCAARTSHAQESEGRFDLGLRGVMLLGQGQPANDMLGEGVVARWRVREHWHVGVTLDTVTFDYETPNRALGIAAATIVDGSNEWSRVGVLLERRYESERRWDWYWLVGAGLASVDDVANVSGTRADGGAFDIATTADDEVHVFAGGGLRRPLGDRWSLETTFTIEHHGTDYELVDVVSGARGSAGSHSPYGIGIGVSYRF